MRDRPSVMQNRDISPPEPDKLYMKEPSKSMGNPLTFRIPGINAFRIPLFIPKPTTPFSSTLILVYSFVALALLGTILLILPLSSRSGVVTSPLNALFTATSAVSVTGLVVVDTGTYWSPFGQAILLILFQIGGIGFISGATILLAAIGGGLGLRDKLILSESMGIDRLGGVSGIVIRVTIFSLAIEAVGALVFYLQWLSSGYHSVSLWTAVFHAVSAFNNCGLDIFGNYGSLIGYQRDAVTLWTTAAIVVLGSAGYVVIMDVLRRGRFNRLTLDSKIVLVTTFSLLVLGTLFYFIAEFSQPATLGPLSVPQKITAAVFQSVTPRTAGFSDIDIGVLSQVSLFFTMFLMFIGGAAGSTAGGVKVNTLGVLVATAVNVVRGNENISAFGKQITRQTVFRAMSLMMFYLGVAGLVIVLLSITEVFPLEKIIFEVFSALSTVGLSTGITPDLSVAGRLIIIVVMFVGRLAPLTFMAFLTRHHQSSLIDYPRESIRLG
jgi:trk system potassium uptake protein